MGRLEDIQPGATIRGILPTGLITVVSVQWFGTDAVELTYKDASGKVSNQLLYRSDEASFQVETEGRPWSFAGDAALFRLVAEARRIQLAHLFDPLLAIHTSLVEPLPHQITAVYDTMIPRQPLRFLLADDPGSGKTIMAGLLIRELMARGDLERCLIVSPGNLVEQWQDEMSRKFNIPFEIMTRDTVEAARTGNWFRENPLAICRLDKLSRDEEIQDKLRDTDWDLVICDEAHKMSASFFGGEVKKTKRYRLGELLSSVTRHLLLMTATPHNGKEQDFQLFMRLLDGDRFEGKLRDGVHLSDTSDLMRRLLKEQLLKFDGTPLFPERRAYTANYTLSNAEARLYQMVTEYVREEFNRADALENEGRRGTVGFALTVLQRRLASSPEAIYQSLKRRRERLETRMREEQLLNRGASVCIDIGSNFPELSEDDIEELEDSPELEIEETEERLVDRATAARTIAELKAEIETLKRLESYALAVRQSGEDKKWEELSSLLQNTPEMFDVNGSRRKLIVFTEHRDTLNYLEKKISALLGKPEMVVIIHGGIGRDQRKNAEQRFTQDKEVQILIATDAAGEGINLQRAHLMFNYDLPGNPNRLEQRFGRIHRIGQTEVCHLWNMVASETREGDVYQRLLDKLNQERESLGGQVFDVLGSLTFEDKPLRELLIDAIRYGDRPDVRAKLNQVIDSALDRDKLVELIHARALVTDSMDISRVQKIREDMERAEARRLQPHYIGSFFIEAFRHLGGTIREREKGRYEITHVPVAVRSRDRLIGTREAILPKYERVTFEKELIRVSGKPVAEFICPGSPLLESVVDLVLERYRDMLRQGAVFIDDRDTSKDIRALVMLEHGIQDAHTDRSGQRRIVSRRMQFVLLDENGHPISAGYAPYLDYRPPREEERESIRKIGIPDWITRHLEEKTREYAIRDLVPGHLEEVRHQKEAMIDKTVQAVKERLTQEITYWEYRAAILKEQERAGRMNARINSEKAGKHADELTARLHDRLRDLEQDRALSPLPPVITGGALILPAGLLKETDGNEEQPPLFARDTARIEALAMAAVIQYEQALGYVPRDVSADKVGYDIESSIPGTGKLRFIEVKGRVKGATTVTVTRNEILTALNKPEDFILALVEVDGDSTVLSYVTKPFGKEPDFAATSVNYNLKDLLADVD